MKKLNPVIRGILGAIGGFAVMMAIEYIKSLIETTFLSQIGCRLLFFQSLLAFSPSLAPMRLNERKTDRNWPKSLKSESCPDTVPDMKVEDPERSACQIVPQACDAQDLSASYL